MKLQKQGSFVISNTEVDPTPTVDEIKNASSNNELKQVVKRMLKQHGYMQLIFLVLLPIGIAQDLK